MTSILVQNATKVYETKGGTPVTALQDVSLVVRQGKFHSIVGPSGCGKSTLLRAILGLHGLSKGSISVDGEPVVGPRRDVGVVFQDASLLPWLTVEKNVLLPVAVQHRSLKSYRSKAEELLKLVGLQDFGGKLPGELSGGMQQRVSIARALIHEPKYLLMDEPFGALDALTRESMQVELQRIWLETKATVILITHSISEAVFLSDRVHVMSARPGRIVDVIDCDFERPRELRVGGDREFAERVERIRRQLV